MGNYNRSTWATLLHKSQSRKSFEKTMEVLAQLLERFNKGETLENVIDKFIAEQQQEGRYTWRYYFAKYADMVKGADGEFVWGDTDYSITTLNRHQFNGQHWDSFLNVVYIKIKNHYNEINDKLQVVSFGNYGENLNILNPVSSVASSPQGFVYYYGMNNEDWTVNRDETGIDLEDRVEMAYNIIVKIIDSKIP